MDAKELALAHSGKALDSLSATEWRELLLEIIKQDNPRTLIPLLRELPDGFKNSCLGPVDRVNLLEFAILHSLWNAAHILVDFECGTMLAAQSDTYKVSDIKWSNAIHRIVKQYLKTREIRSLHKDPYPEALNERAQAYWKAFNNGFVSLFSSLHYPRTFILLHKLGADIRRKNNMKLFSKYGNIILLTNSLTAETVLHSLLVDKSATMHVKLPIIRYILKVAGDLLYEPSGFEGIPPILYCYQHNVAKVIKEVNIPLEKLLGVRTTSGQTILDLVSIKHLPRYLSSERLLNLFISENALTSLLQRAEKSKVSFQLPEICQALEILVQQDKPISQYLKEYTIPYLRAYLLELGVKDVKLAELEPFYEKHQKEMRAKKRAEISRIRKISENFVGHFPVDQLPSDMLALMAVHLSLQDVVALYSVSKAMREKYESAYGTESMLWKIVAKNTFNKQKFSTYEQRATNSNDRNWKNFLIRDSRLSDNWSTKKFTERILVKDNPGMMVLSEHWGFWNSTNYWNCDTGEIKKGNPLPHSFMRASFVESSPTRDPVLTTYTSWPDPSLVVFSPAGVLGQIKGIQSLTHQGVATFDGNFAVVGDRLSLVDISQEKVISSLPTRLASHHTVNKFSKSPVIIATTTKQQIELFDKNLTSLQKIDWGQSMVHRLRPYAIDENRILLIDEFNFHVLDTRFTKPNEVAGSARFPHRNFWSQYQTQILHAFDEVNSRLVLRTYGTRHYNLMMVWDLNKMTWSSMWRQKDATYSMAINSRYLAANSLDGFISVNDFSD